MFEVARSMYNKDGTTRRHALGIGLAVLASPAIGAAAPKPQLYGGSIVIDGNLIASSLFEQSSIDSATATRIRRAASLH
jgi:hypothetical protein